MVGERIQRKLPESDKQFLAELARLGSQNAMAREYGCSRGTVQQRWKAVKRRGTPSDLAQESTPALEASVLELVRRNPADTRALGERLAATPDAILDAMRGLRRSGYEVQEIGGQWMLIRVPMVLPGEIRRIGDHTDRIIRFGACSDSHYGSSAQQRTALHDFYRQCEALEIEHVFNSGDLVAVERDKAREELARVTVERDNLLTDRATLEEIVGRLQSERNEALNNGECEASLRRQVERDLDIAISTIKSLQEALNRLAGPRFGVILGATYDFRSRDPALLAGLQLTFR